ncbi:MAG: cyclic nucleotide-binding domain-containing protein [Dehalococcoidia bacterium]
MAPGRPEQHDGSLARQPVFARCSDKELETVAGMGTPIAVEPGYVLTREGRHGHEFFVITDGRAACSIGGEQVSTLEAGDFFGEVALLDGGTRSATVVAETAMKVIVIDSREFSVMIRDVPSAARQIMVTLAQRLRAAEARV